jgi:hypothetical protein
LLNSVHQRIPAAAVYRAARPGSFFGHENGLAIRVARR